MANIQPGIMTETGRVSLGFYVALQSTGIIEISFEPGKNVNESLSVVSINTDAGFMPGWLTSFGDKIYSISRTSYPDDSMSESGGVFAFQKASATPSATSRTGLALFDQASSNGKGGVHCQVSPDGKILVATNITASTLSVYPLSENGAIGEPSHILDYESESNPKEAHPHQAIFDPSGKFLIVPLRTMDRVDIYSIKSPQQVSLVHSIPVPASSGPRHVAFNPISPSNAYMYLVSEKDNSIRVFTLNYSGTASGELAVEFKQTLSTMGKDFAPTPDEHEDLAAEIAVSNDGKFVYASNRNLTRPDADTLAIYSVDNNPANDSRHLTYLGSQEIPGKHPRMFALSNDKENKWVAVAQQFSQDVFVFERDMATGFLKGIKGRVSLGVATPHQSAPEVTFVKDTSVERKLSREELLKGRKEGPMCVLWK